MAEILNFTKMTFVIMTRTKGKKLKTTNEVFSGTYETPNKSHPTLHRLEVLLWTHSVMIYWSCRPASNAVVGNCRCGVCNLIFLSRRVQWRKSHRRITTLFLTILPHSRVSVLIFNWYEMHLMLLILVKWNKCQVALEIWSRWPLQSVRSFPTSFHLKTLNLRAEPSQTSFVNVSPPCCAQWLAGVI